MKTETEIRMRLMKLQDDNILKLPIESVFKDNCTGRALAQLELKIKINVLEWVLEKNN